MSLNSSDEKQKNDQEKPASGFVNNVLDTFNKQNKEVKLAIIGMIVSLLVPFISGGFSIITTVIEASASSNSQTTPAIVYVTPQATSNPVILSPTPAVSTSNLPALPNTQQFTPSVSGFQITYFETSIFLALLITLVFFFIGTSAFLKKLIKAIGLGLYFILTVALILCLYFIKSSIVWGIVTLFLAGFMYITLYERSNNWDSLFNGRASSVIGFFTLYGLLVGFAIIFAGWAQLSYFEYVPETLIVGYPVFIFAISKA